MFDKFKMTIAFIFVAMLAIVGCSSSEAAPAYDVVTPASINPGDGIPAPSGEVILTLTGGMTETNAGDILEFDMETLEKLGLVKYTVKEPWLEVDVTFTGVLMSDLLKVTGVPSSATTTQLVALDDYQVEITTADIHKYPVLLATQADGKYMSIEHGGPTRIIFPYNTYPELDPVSYTPLWIWSIRTMVFR